MATWHRYKIKCAYCGKEVIKNNKQEVCSMECRDVLKKQRFIESAPEGICPACGEFGKLIYKVHDLRACSERCKRRIYSTNYRAQNELLPRSIHIRQLIRQCDYCGKEYEPLRYNSRFCCRKCGYNWRYHYGGKKEKEREERKEERASLERKIGKCALCQTPHELIVPMKEMSGGKSRSTIVKFHKDHIIPSANGGSNNPANFRYLCWFCNIARGNMKPEYDNAIIAAGHAFWKTINEEIK